ncbi:MAG: transport energizing protein, ExbD/TolR family [Bacteroidetes bacterium]|jgi:biopolymer transport protein ExbD|nr:transport energizing protein, ExbD/TolR family [Bacteroidota bacterium]
MALKKRIKVEAGFSMSSMTDIIFLLLLFFIMASTMSSPNDIKLNLPQSKATSSTKSVIAKVSIDADGNYFVAKGSSKPEQVAPELLESYIMNLVAQDTTTFIALHADQDRSFKEVVKVLDIANQHKLKLVIATQTQESK